LAKLGGRAASQALAHPLACNVRMYGHPMPAAGADRLHPPGGHVDRTAARRRARRPRAAPGAAAPSPTSSRIWSRAASSAPSTPRCPLAPEGGGGRARRGVSG
jgi:hypothetical protein